MAKFRIHYGFDGQSEVIDASNPNDARQIFSRSWFSRGKNVPPIRKVKSLEKKK